METAKEAKPQAEIGIFGGSGFYQLLENAREIWVETPYGAPSDRIAVGELAGRQVAFLPRHGKDHRYPPHRINYRANLWAMKELGVTRIIGPCAAGSLQPHIKPGDFVFCDQFVNRTWGREDTFCEGPIVTHVSAADPYCAEMRQVAQEAARALGYRYHERGTVVVIQGPRFSTRAESREFRQHGWEVINMTQYPEVILARELGICYLNISLITDHDVGVEDEPGVNPVSHEEVLRVFAANNERLKHLLAEVVRRLPAGRCRTCQAG
ncbi:MAG: S-methyl-5'-thioadenosine phosphorylase [Limnochordales bacterium]|nr:S-methyl-5'-thioadenosine phosphorylase [Limnochordales bacterium]